MNRTSKLKCMMRKEMKCGIGDTIRVMGPVR